MKRIGIIIGVGIAIGIVLLIIQQSFQIDPDTFSNYYWSISFLVIVLSVFINIIYCLYYSKKMQGFMQQLNQGDTDGFIQNVQQDLLKIKGKFVREFYQLNLSVGYIYAKEYQKARDILENLGHVKGALKDAQAINLTLLYFYLEEISLGLSAHATHYNAFRSLIKHPVYGASIHILDIYVLFHEGKYNEAKEASDKTKATFPDEKFQEDYQMLEKKLEGIPHE